MLTCRCPGCCPSSRPKTSLACGLLNKGKRTRKESSASCVQIKLYMIHDVDTGMAPGRVSMVKVNNNGTEVNTLTLLARCVPYHEETLPYYSHGNYADEGQRVEPIRPAKKSGTKVEWFS